MSGESVQCGLMRELKTTQKMRYEKVILAVVFVMFGAAIWLIMVK